MKYKGAIVLAGLLLGGCATLPPPTATDLSGEWRFAYAQKTLVMFGQDFTPPPSFDIIEFKDTGAVRLVNSLMRHEFTGNYTLDGNRLEWTFSPPDVKKPVEHRLECSWTENGRALVLRPSEDGEDSSTGTEWVFYKPRRFLPGDTITGKWVATVDGEKGDMTFERDGRYYMDGKKIWGYYRLWPSRYGNTLTTPIWIQGEGGFIVLYLYNLDGDKLTLTPLTPNGPEKKGKLMWSRSKEKDAPNQVSEATSEPAPGAASSSPQD